MNLRDGALTEGFTKENLIEAIEEWSNASYINVGDSHFFYVNGDYYTGLCEYFEVEFDIGLSVVFFLKYFPGLLDYRNQFLEPIDSVEIRCKVLDEIYRAIQ